jgi:hypothetical protein
MPGDGWRMDSDLGPTARGCEVLELWLCGELRTLVSCFKLQSPFSPGETPLRRLARKSRFSTCRAGGGPPKRQRSLSTARGKPAIAMQRVLSLRVCAAGSSKPRSPYRHCTASSSVVNRSHVVGFVGVRKEIGQDAVRPVHRVIGVAVLGGYRSSCSGGTERPQS